MAKPVFEQRDNEEVFAQRVSGDTWRNPRNVINRQVSGKFYFTNQRIVFLASGLIGTASVSWELEMKDIASVKTCMTPPCFPFGILIQTKNGETYKIGVMKREQYIEWINRWLTV